MSSAPPMQRLKTPSQPLALATSSTIFWTAIGGERRPRRRLPDHRVAADRRDHGVPGPDRDREIEGRDDADRPQRLPLLDHAVPRRVRWRSSGRRAGATSRRRSRTCRSFPGPRPRPRLRILPVSRVTRSPRSALSARRAAADLADDLAATRRRDHPPASKRFASPAPRPAHNRRRRPSALAAVARPSPGLSNGSRRCPVAVEPVAAADAAVGFADPQATQQSLEHGMPSFRFELTECLTPFS